MSFSIHFAPIKLTLPQALPPKPNDWVNLKVAGEMSLLDYGVHVGELLESDIVLIYSSAKETASGKKTLLFYYGGA